MFLVQATTGISSLYIQNWQELDSSFVFLSESSIDPHLP